MTPDQTTKGEGMLHQAFATVLEAKCRDHLFASVMGFTRELEFETFTAIAVLDRPGAESEFHAVDNTPDGFSQVLEDPERGKRDPVMQHCKTSSLPIVWDQETYVRSGTAHMWEEQAPYGYRTGICVAMHLSAGRHLCIGLDRDNPLPRSADEIAYMAARLLLFATFLQEVALRILIPSSPQPHPVAQLSPREQECLEWTTEGKTAWEIGRILSISEQTAVRHLNNATHKLGCVNKHQAVARALRLGMLR